MERFFYSYILCGLVCGLIVAITEIWKKTYRGQYILGTLMMPSVVFGNWRHTFQADSREARSVAYMRLTWMSRIHFVLIIAAIFMPYNYIGNTFSSMMEPGIQSNDHIITAGAEMAIEMGMVMLDGLVGFINFLLWVIAYLVIGFFMVILPILFRPSN